MVWLFGEENAPPDYIMQVMVDNGIGAAQRAHMDRQMAAMARHGGTRAGMMKFLRNIGIGASAATTLATYAYNNRASAGREQRQEGLGKRKSNTPEETQPTKYHRTEDQEDEADFEGREALLPALPDTNDDDLRELPEDLWEEMGMDVEGDESELIREDEDKANLEFILDFDSERAMEVDGGPGGEQVAARAASGGGGPSSVSKETAISPYPSLSYGLQETHTTILPWRGYCSVAQITNTEPIQLRFRMNTPWDMMMTELTTLASGGTAASSLPYILPLGPGGTNVAGAVFPVTLTAGAQAGERPQWRDWWAGLYTYYTVLGCKYRVTVVNSGNARGADIEVAQYFDTYSDTQGTTGNITPATTYQETKAFKNIKWHVIRDGTSEANVDANAAIIEGTYKPGQARRNIQNDGDVKTWTACGTTLPNLKEVLNLSFFKAGLNYASIANTCANVMIELDYIVQFKDLKEQARYPNSENATFNVSLQIADDISDDVRMIV